MPRAVRRKRRKKKKKKKRVGVGVESKHVRALEGETGGIVGRN